MERKEFDCLSGMPKGRVRDSGKENLRMRGTWRLCPVEEERSLVRKVEREGWGRESGRDNGGEGESSSLFMQC